MRFVATATSTFLLLVAPALAQDRPPSTHEHLKVLTPLVGKWHARITASKDLPDGTTKKGDRLELFLSNQWLADKSAVSTNWHMKSETATLVNFAGLIGWNAKEDSIVSGGFRSTGGSIVTLWKRQGEEWQLVNKGVNGEGKATTHTLVLSEITKNSFHSQSVHRTEDGKELPDGEKIMWKRVE